MNYGGWPRIWQGILKVLHLLRSSILETGWNGAGGVIPLVHGISERIITLVFIFMVQTVQNRGMVPLCILIHQGENGGLYTLVSKLQGLKLFSYGGRMEYYCNWLPFSWQACIVVGMMKRTEILDLEDGILFSYIDKPRTFRHNSSLDLLKAPTMTRSDYLELIMDHAINQGLSTPDFIRKVYAMDNAELAIMLDKLEAEADDYGCHPHFE